MILRLSYSDIGSRSGSVKNNKAIHQFLNGRHTIPELDDCLIYADKEEKAMPDVDGILLEKFQWSKQLFWEGKRVDRPIIVVIDQTCSRSTELACHNRLFALHDFRNKVTFSTSSQALERVNHYDTRYGGFQPIRVYGHKKTFELSARRINYETYLNSEWIKKKLDVRRGLGEACYVIRKPIGEHEVHPLYPDPMTDQDCVRALQVIGCFAEVTISPRVSGKICPVRVYACEFEPCAKDTFQLLKTRLDQRFNRTFNNPFARSELEGLENGQYKGHLRAWSVFDFETQVKTQPGWGVTADTPRLTICYQDGVLGVAIRYDTGITVEQDTLVTFKSMYKK
jgi:hypothetical protein